ncbi:hypothetical protein SBA4_1560013 [Candidatus Sulfopaludibacter sp. SbA4]|nr:hypothetical protein SBA4_1560013 [Candidatus Sulfopaludibacter sp. SbA4]
MVEGDGRRGVRSHAFHAFLARRPLLGGQPDHGRCQPESEKTAAVHTATFLQIRSESACIVTPGLEECGRAGRRWQAESGTDPRFSGPWDANRGACTTGVHAGRVTPSRRGEALATVSVLARIRKGTGVDGGDVWVTLKIVRVEREQMSHRMNLHSGGQPCVMHLNAGDGMGDNQTPPFVVDGFAIRQ